MAMRWPVVGIVAIVGCGVAGCGGSVTDPVDGGSGGGPPPPPPGTSVVPAFPGAEGFGANTVGGRGGTVIAVTSLNDAGPGSLREAVEASGPRIIVFRVGGTIDLVTPLAITEPFVTIAGQTAPGGGIALRNAGSVTRGLVQVLTNDVVIRHLRIRPGPDDSPTGSCCLDALSVNTPAAFNVVIDHVSMSWAVDEVGQVFDGAHDITFQWSIFAEGLFCSNHEKTVSSRGGNGPCPDGSIPHSRGMTITAPPGSSTPPDRISLHHNLWAHHEIRQPNVSSNTMVDVVNNVVYDFTEAGSRLGLKDPGAPVRVNFVNNVYRPGPSTISRGIQPWVVALDPPSFGDQGAFEVYFDGNDVQAPIRMGWEDWQGQAARHRVFSPQPAREGSSTTPTSAADGRSFRGVRHPRTPMGTGCPITGRRITASTRRTARTGGWIPISTGTPTSRSFSTARTRRPRAPECEPAGARSPGGRRRVSLRVRCPRARRPCAAASSRSSSVGRGSPSGPRPGRAWRARTRRSAPDPRPGDCRRART